MAVTISEARLEREVSGTRIYRVDTTLDEALTALRSVGIERPISVRDYAHARIENGKFSPLSLEGCFTSAGFLHAAKEKTLLALDSPLNDYTLARKAVRANRNEEYFSTGDLALYEKYLKQAEKDKSKAPEERSVLILPSEDQCQPFISLNKNSDVLKGVLKDLNEDYLNFTGLSSLRVCPLPQGVVDKRTGTLLTQLHFSRFGDFYLSSLIGYGLMHCPLIVRGIKESKPTK